MGQYYAIGGTLYIPDKVAFGEAIKNFTEKEPAKINCKFSIPSSIDWSDPAQAIRVITTQNENAGDVEFVGTVGENFRYDIDLDFHASYGWGDVLQDAFVEALHATTEGYVTISAWDDCTETNIWKKDGKVRGTILHDEELG